MWHEALTDILKLSFGIWKFSFLLWVQNVIFSSLIKWLLMNVAQMYMHISLLFIGSVHYLKHLQHHIAIWLLVISDHVWYIYEPVWFGIFGKPHPNLFTMFRNKIGNAGLQIAMIWFSWCCCSCSLLFSSTVCLESIVHLL